MIIGIISSQLFYEAVVWTLIVRGQLSGGNYRGGNSLGGNYPGGNFPEGNYPGGNCPVPKLKASFPTNEHTSENESGD